MRATRNNSWRFKCLLNGLCMLYLWSPHTSGQLTDVCGDDDSEFAITLVTATRRSWEEAHLYCQDEDRGHLARLDDTVLRDCVGDILRRNATTSSAWSGATLWVDGRFDCPHVGNNADQLQVEYGTCSARKSFICEESCNPNNGSRCVRLKQKCLCVHQTANDKEPTWLQAQAYCREQPGGELAEVSQQNLDTLGAVLDQSGRYWIGLSAEEKYSYYEKYQSGHLCESVGLAEDNALETDWSDTCSHNKAAICMKYLGPLKSKEDTSTAAEKMDRKQKISTGILAMLIVISILLFVGTVTFFIMLYIRYSRAVKAQKGCVPYDGITFFKNDIATKCDTQEGPPITSDLYSEIPSAHVRIPPPPSNNPTGSGIMASSSANTVAALHHYPPDVVTDRNNVNRRNGDSSNDLTLPANIPTEEVANVFIHRELNKPQHGKTKLRKLNHISAFRRPKEDIADPVKTNDYQNVAFPGDNPGYI